MAEKPRFERPTTPKEEHELVLDRNKYLLEYIARQNEEHTYDDLTRLKNRKFFERELDQALKMVRGEINEKRKGVEPLKEISIISIDIDNFKMVNDTLGHPAGDEVLRSIAKLLTASVRETDTVARLGGEELMILMREAGEGDATHEAEKLRKKIEQMTFRDYSELKITASFGVISSKSSTDSKILCEMVDKALYAAKCAGRNRVETYKEDKKEDKNKDI